MSLTARVLVALVAGLVLGAAGAATQSRPLLAVAAAVEPVGTLFINAIRMTVIPLVVASLIAGVAAAPDTRAIGRVGVRAVVFFFAVLLLASAFGAVVATSAFSALTLSPAAAEAMRASAASAGATAVESAARQSSVAEWLVGLVPANPVKAAADGAMLPLIVFSLAFGLALARVAPDRRLALLRGVQAIADASLTLVRWVLALAPIGVFALTVPLATRLGLSAVGALATYVAVVALACVVFALLVLYPVARVVGGVPLVEFARASAPAQAVAFSARSSLAALPAMIEGAERWLRPPREVTTFFLPLAATTFRTGAGLWQPIAAAFVAHLYGIELGAAQLATVALTGALTSFSIPGVPAGSVIVMVPVLGAAGLPPEGAGILIGIDTIPDMFRTTANVTGDMAGAAALGRWRPGTPAADR